MAAHRTHLDDRTARRDLATAHALQRHGQVREALRDGHVDRARAEVVMTAIDALPDDLDTCVVEHAEQHLLGQAVEFNPTRLRILGRKVLAVVAPEVDEEHERRRLEDEDGHADAVTALHTHRRGDGTTDVKLRCADHLADRLLTYLESLLSPRRPDRHDTGTGTGTATGQSDRRPYPQRLGYAFGTLLEHLDPSRLPLHGGDATTVIVTLDLSTLPTGLGVALVGDQPLTAAQARRLACTAHLIPAVLDTESQILDLGRSRRLYSPAQRKAMRIRRGRAG